MNRDEATDLFSKVIKSESAKKILKEIVESGTEVLIKNPDGAELKLKNGFEIQVGGVIQITE